MTTPEQSEIILRQNLPMFPDQNPIVQSALLDFTNTMPNDQRTVREVSMKGGKIETELPNDFAYIIGSQITPRLVDLAYSYSPRLFHYSNSSDVQEFAMRLYGDTRTGESVEIVPTSSGFKKQHIEGHPLRLTPSDNMNALETNELKTVMSALVPYETDSDIVLGKATRLIELARGVFAALVASSTSAYELNTVVQDVERNRGEHSQVTITKRNYIREDNERTDKQVFGIEYKTTRLFPIILGEEPIIPVTRTVQYRFSSSSNAKGTNPNALIVHSCEGDPESHNQKMWLNNIATQDGFYYIQRATAAQETFLDALQEVEIAELAR